MTSYSGRDIVIDTNVMRLYDTPKDSIFIDFFKWIKEKAFLRMSQKLLIEYDRSGNKKILILINELQRKGRYALVRNQELNSFTDDRHFNYTCNHEDINHARLVFISNSKRLIAFDNNLVKDVNSYHKINGVKPCACKKPKKCCYK